MSIAITTQSGVTHTGAFGQIPNNLIDSVTLEQVKAQSGQIQRICGTDDIDYELLETKVIEFRTQVGALWLQTWRQLDKDINRAYRVSESFLQCFFVSIFSSSLRPQRYYRLCGIPNQGYGAQVMLLANSGLKQEVKERLAKEWGAASAQNFVDRIWRTKNQLIEKEAEYRAATNIIVQVGIGWGGMVVGLVGLVIGVGFSFWGGNDSAAQSVTPTADVLNTEELPAVLEQPAPKPAHAAILEQPVPELKPDDPTAEIPQAPGELPE